MNPRARNPVDVFHFRIDVNKVSVRSQRRSLQGEADRCWVAALDFALVGGTEAFGPSSIPRVFAATQRSEEHTSELQSRLHLVCRLLLEQKKIARHRRNLLPG